MRRAKILSGAILFLAAIGFAVAVDATSEGAYAQGYPLCPAGYYWDPNYGSCLPLNYFYGPPYYVYPDFGFNFFYGGGWGARRGYGVGRGVAPRGGGTHGVGRGGGGRR
jgi:hypothetical protein